MELIIGVKTGGYHHYDGKEPYLSFTEKQSITIACISGECTNDFQKVFLCHIFR